MLFILIRLIYYPIHRKKDYLFTYFLFNILIFFLCVLLNSVKLSIGFAFGLFAIFGVLRYRTEQISIKDMTYLFAVITHRGDQFLGEQEGERGRTGLHRRHDPGDDLRAGAPLAHAPRGHEAADLRAHRPDQAGEPDSAVCRTCTSDWA